MPTVQISERGQFTVPKKFLEVLGLQKGGVAEAELEGERLVITPKRSTKEESLQKLKAVMSRVHEQNKGFSEKEVTEDVLKAVTELRAEESVQTEAKR